MGNRFGEQPRCGWRGLIEGGHRPRRDQAKLLKAGEALVGEADHGGVRIGKGPQKDFSSFRLLQFSEKVAGFLPLVHIPGFQLLSKFLKVFKHPIRPLPSKISPLPGAHAFREYTPKWKFFQTQYAGKRCYN